MHLGNKVHKESCQLEVPRPDPRAQRVSGEKYHSVLRLLFLRLCYRRFSEFNFGAAHTDRDFRLVVCVVPPMA